MENKPIRILQFVPIMQPAGIENFIMNLYRNIDHNEIQFDFVVHSKAKGFYDDEIEKLGGKIYRFTYKDDKNFVKYVRDLNDFFNKHNEYKIIHGNMQSMMPVYLKIAKKHNVPIRIAHAHNSSYEKSIKGYLLHLLSRFVKYQANVKFACSDKAGKYLFGKEKFEFIPNAIDIKKFEFSNEQRKKIRNELNISEQTILIGNIGRFELQKNHKRLIKIFKTIKDNYVNLDVKLLLLGKGKLENKIKRQVEKKDLQEDVLFLGNKKNTFEYYSAMDVFLFPSLYEGLPVTGIEAQASGLNCVFSDEITKEVNITGNIKYISLKEKDCTWAQATIENSFNKNNRKIINNQILKTEFDINNNAQYMKDKYLKYYNNISN